MIIGVQIGKDLMTNLAMVTRLSIIFMIQKKDKASLIQSSHLSSRKALSPLIWILYQKLKTTRNHRDARFVCPGVETYHVFALALNPGVNNRFVCWVDDLDKPTSQSQGSYLVGGVPQSEIDISDNWEDLSLIDEHDFNSFTPSK